MQECLSICIRTFGFRLYLLLRSHLSVSSFNISYESLSQTFYNINKVNFLQSIVLNKDKNSNDITNDKEDLTVVPIPSGTSIGGSAWTCNYRLFNFIYASQFSIETKIISDPFPYKKLKKNNYFITDNIYQKEVPIVRKVVDEDFDKKMRECLENKKNIFIPTDNINSMLEMLVKFEKLLDEYKESSNKLDKPEYKILVCSNCSNEIVEGIKSLTEFLGKKVSQQFCSFGEKPFNFEDAICIKNKEEFLNEYKKNIKYIILATFETLNIGLGYSILPNVLSDNNVVMVNIFREYDSESKFGKIIKEVKNFKKKLVTYDEKKVVERKKPEKKEKMEEEKTEKDDEDNNNNEGNQNNKNNLSSNVVKNNIINNSSYKMIVEKQKLFNIPNNKDFNGYLSFNYENKNKYTDYGIELSKEEIDIMKKNNE